LHWFNGEGVPNGRSDETEVGLTIHCFWNLTIFAWFSFNRENPRETGMRMDTIRRAKLPV
jgi:hypothetical protein